MYNVLPFSWRNQNAIFLAAISFAIPLWLTCPREAAAELAGTSLNRQSAEIDTTQQELLERASNIKQPSSLLNIQIERNSTEAKSTELPIFEWSPNQTEPKAIVIMVHGLLQHGESFEPMAKHLASRGYLAVPIDQRGHGYWHFKNGVKKPGYSIDYDQSIADVSTLAKIFRAKYPTLPIYCMGESAGAAVAVRSAATYPGLYDGLVLCAFATKPRAVRVLWTTEDVITNMFNWHGDIKMNRYVKRFTSEDDRITMETVNDPMCRTGISLKELLNTCKFMRTTAKLAKRLSPNLPLLIVEGQDDQVLDPKSSIKFLEHARCEFKNLILIPHCGHVLISTHYLKPLIVESIDGWLDQHTPGQFATNAIVAHSH